MKPRTQFQHSVVSANEQIQPISQKQIEWAETKLTPHFSFRTKGKENVCSECGESFIYDQATKTCRCPHCGTLLKIQDTRKKNISHRSYFSSLEIVNGIQVQRVFQLNSTFYKGQRAVRSGMELLRLWFDGEGQSAVTSKKRRPFSYYLDAFFSESEIELRPNNPDYLLIADTAIAPKAQIHPFFAKKGVTKRLLNKVSPSLLLTDITRNPHFETIAKLNRAKDLAYFLDNPGADKKVWNAYRITIRRKYDIKDISLWIDLVSALQYLGKDITNDHYVCPDNLKIAHDYWCNKRAEKQTKERIEKEYKQLVKNEETFAKMKSKFFDINITDGLINIVVLDSVRAFIEEGKMMHHCVAGYWDREDSLVLSARINDKRIETIEVNLNTLKVVQSRAVCNGISEHHERILNLVNSNIGKIASRLTA